MSQDKVKPAVSSLGLALQAATWMGQGPAPARSTVMPRPCSAPAPPPAEASANPPAAAPMDPGSLASREQPAIAAEEETCEPMPSAPVPPSNSTAPASPAEAPAMAGDLPVRVEGDRVEAEIGDRHYVVRGLQKNTSHDLMKVNVKVVRGEAFHVDNLDVYSHRQRQAFQRAAAGELELDEQVVKRDLGRVLLQLEKLRDAALAKTLEPKKAETVEIPKERKLAALTQLRTPGLIPWIDESLSLCGLVGERTNKVVAYLACVSRLLAKPLAIMVQSSSAAGKSALMEAVLALMPEESRVKYSAMTGQALFYVGETVDLRHKILAIAEEEGASRATYALKLLQSEGELSIVSTGKDPQTGELVSKVYEVRGPIMPIIPTTNTDIDEEWENRVIKLSVDEGREQTRRIHEVQRQMMTLEGIVAQRKRATVVQLHQDAQRLLRPLQVRIPYAMRLTFPSHATRTRRDHMKYLGLIQAITLLHQYQREVKETATEDGQTVEYIDATPEDVELANELANEVLGRSLGELPAQTQAFLEELHELVTKTCEARQVARADCRITRREILDHTHLSMTRVRAHLQRLVDYEYVMAHRGRNGETFVYEVLYNGEARQRERFVMGLLDAGRLRQEGAAPTTGDLACLGGHLASTMPPPCLDLAPTLPGGTNGGNGASPKGSSGSDPRSAENAKGPKSNGEARRSRTGTVEDGAR